MARKARAAATVRTKVGRCDLGKVRELVLDDSLRKFGFDPAGFVSLEHKVQALFEHMEQANAGELPREVRMTDCDHCGGECDTDLVVQTLGEHCPYCGDGSEDPAILKLIEKADKAMAKADKDKVKGRPKAEKAEKEPKTKRRARDAEPEPVVEATAEVVDLDKHRKSEALVPAKAVDGKLIVGDERALDKATIRIQELKADLVHNMWDLGRVLTEVVDGKLWKFRASDNGVSLYKDFESWCRSEVGLSSKTAYYHVSIFRAFSEEDCKAIGSEKLKVALGLPPGEHREKLLEEARKGASKSELQRAVAETRRLEGLPAAAKPDALISMRGPKREKLRLNKRLKGGKGKEFVAASSIADEPWAAEDYGPISCHYKVIADKKGDWYLLIERERVG